MRRSTRVMSGLCAVGLVGAMLLLGTRSIHAHCDTMDGPVVSAAKAALERGDVRPVLKWVRTADEPEIRHAFELAMAVRDNGPEARELADRSFFETLVRVHRAGEGVAFEGIKPVGTPIGEAVEAADKALANGSVDEVVKMVTTHVEHGIRERFARAAEARRSAEQNVEAGRRYVAAYVDFVHYVERLDADAQSAAGATHATGGSASEPAHEAVRPAAPGAHGHER